MNVIPRPATMTPGTGGLALGPSVRLVLERDSSARPAAALLARRLRSGAGLSVDLGEAGLPPVASTARIQFRTVPGLPSEGYRLDVSSSAAVVEASASGGFFAAVQTIRQLLPPEIEHDGGHPIKGLSIPACRIEDGPRFGWRGFLLDCCRHFMPVPVVTRFLDILAFYKYNRLHWHLTEDQGWRLASERYPKLTEIAAWRSKAEPDGPAEKYGGFYTRADVRAVLDHAASVGIEVVPEIELPGHSVAALAAYPELGCTGGPYEVATTWGIFDDVYCAGNEKTFEFLEGVLTEVCDLFPSSFIHLGADEVPKTRWKACPRCQARIKAEGLKDEHELQSWFVHRIIKFLSSKGKRSICWDEILEGGPPPGVIVQVWRCNHQALGKSAAAGRDIIHSPYSHVYLNEAPKRLDLRVAHDFNPMMEYDATWDATGVNGVSGKPSGLTDTALLGGEACLWSEHCPPEKVWYQMLPRAQAVAENLWSPAAGKFWDEFLLRSRAHAARLKVMGVEPGPERIDSPT